MELEQKFQEAMERVMSLTSRPSNDTMLKLYSLKKQATEGDVNIPKPKMFDMVGMAKYKAWKSVSGTSKEAAMEQYIQLVDTLLAK